MEGFRDGIEANVGTGELILSGKEGCFVWRSGVTGMKDVDTKWQDNVMDCGQQQGNSYANQVRCHSQGTRQL